VKEPGQGGDAGEGDQSGDELLGGQGRSSIVSARAGTGIGIAAGAPAYTGAAAPSSTAPSPIVTMMSAISGGRQPPADDATHDDCGGDEILAVIAHAHLVQRREAAAPEHFAVVRVSGMAGTTWACKGGPTPL
jgi:hypothetical protein